jgi:hypothetical protein
MDDTQITPVKTKAPKTPKPPKAPKTPRPRAAGKARSQGGGRASGCFGAVFNLLALLFVLLSCLSALAVGAVFNGALAFIPGGSRYMPPTDLALVAVLSTSTPFSGTPGAQYPTLPPVWTPTDTPTITPTPLPGTQTPIPSATAAVPTPTATPTRTATRPTPTRTGPTPRPTVTRSAFAYSLQAGSPTYLSNFLNTAGCNWFGIVGRAFGMDGNPVINLTVHLEGGGINVDTVTGSGPSALGPGSYQIPISDHPIDTTDTYHIQLRNNSGNLLSDVYSIRTYGDCPRNLVLVNFVQNH